MSLSLLIACGGEPATSDAGTDAAAEDAAARDAARVDAGPPAEEVFATLGARSEGIALGHTPEGESVLFVGTGDDRIVRVTPDGTVSELASINDPLGIAVAADGTLVVCAKQDDADGAASGLFAVTADGTVSTLIASGPGDEPFTLTNFVAIAPDGSLVLSDSNANRVFRADADGTNVTLVTDAITYPNGLAFSPDGATLYVASWSTSSLYALSFDAATGTYGAPTVAYEGITTVDGVVATSSGALVLVTSGRAGVVVIDPSDPAAAPTTLSTGITLPANGVFGDEAFGRAELYLSTLGEPQIYVVHTELMAP